MRIRWINHPNPKSQHLNGKIVHEPRESVAPFIVSGQCEEVPYKNYVERLAEEEQLRQAAIPQSQRDAFYPTPTWQLHKLMTNNKYVVVRLHLTERMVYQAAIVFDRGRPDFKATQKSFASLLKTVGCPEAVIKQWVDADNAPDYRAAEAARIEQDKIAAARQQERERHAIKFI